MIISYADAIEHGARFLGWENFAGDRITYDTATVAVYELDYEILCYTCDAHDQIETLK